MPPRIPFKMSPILCIDLFTMLDAKPISKALAAQLPSGTLPDKIHSIADKWRMLQAQYTWRLNSMGISLLSVSPFSPRTDRLQL